MKKEGMTILVSTAYLDEGEKCDRLALMHRSKVIVSAPPQEIQFPFSDLEEAMIHQIKIIDETLIHDGFKL
jgi:ABC-type multidrug transport system ATPase subunit